ncbi:hypothetical protein ACM43_14505 [Bradyrhizobium sp. CCBAU 45321]|nr:hypothetical protein [Bradyrhizobium sp. CCBAU 45321]
MYDVYLNGRHDLLVVPQGFSVPPDLEGNWKRKKRGVRSVSDRIRQDVQLCGYHRRKLINRSHTLAEDARVL